MHIGYLTTEYPHPDLPSAGGIGSFVKLMATSLIEKNWEVTIFLALREENKIWLDGKVRIVEIKKGGASIFSVFKDRLKISKIIKNYIQQDNIKLIEAPDWEGLHAFCNFKIPLITRIHGSHTYFSYLALRKPSRIINLLEILSFRNSTKIIAVSNYSALLTASLFKLNNDDIEVIYLGIHVNRYNVLSNANDNKKPLLVHFGSLTRKKGVLDIPHIFNELVKLKTNCELLIFGKDTIDTAENRSTWEMMTESFTDEAIEKVTYLGAIPFENVEKYIANATACLFTSYAETFGLVTIESMAMRKPVIIYDFPWVREIIDNGVDGVLIPPKKFRESAKTISKIITNNKMVDSIGSQARIKVKEKFDLSEKTVENIKFYEKCLRDE